SAVRLNVSEPILVPGEQKLLCCEPSEYAGGRVGTIVAASHWGGGGGLCLRVCEACVRAAVCEPCRGGDRMHSPSGICTAWWHVCETHPSLLCTTFCPPPRTGQQQREGGDLEEEIARGIKAERTPRDGWKQVGESWMSFTGERDILIKTHTPPKGRTNSLSRSEEVRKEPSTLTQRVGRLPGVVLHVDNPSQTA
ncbi:hypothetical protein JOQ06_017087, partial [Pogonophryne albipinna]